MSRRVTGLVALVALALATVLVVALTADRTTSSTATAEPSAPASSVAPPATPRPTKAQRRAARRSAATSRLLEDNHCWVGQAPDGAAPAHAVVTLPRSEPALVDAEVGFGIWLEGEPGVLHGFCP